MGALWVAKGPTFLQTENLGSDPTERMCRAETDLNLLRLTTLFLNELVHLVSVASSQ